MSLFLEQQLLRCSKWVPKELQECVLLSLGGREGVKRMAAWNLTCADLARALSGEGAIEAEDFDFRDAFRVIHDAELM